MKSYFKNEILNVFPIFTFHISYILVKFFFQHLSFLEFNFLFVFFFNAAKCVWFLITLSDFSGKSGNEKSGIDD